MKEAFLLFTLMVVSGLSFVVGVLVMIHGWGLDPQSWLWIICGALVHLLLAIFLHLLMDLTK